jgi:predicted secreted protein
MNWTTGAAVYFIVWWVVLFAVLPWGVKPIEEEDVAKGHASSAPKAPRMLIKVLATTLIAAVVWGIVYVVIDQNLISFRD